MKTFENIKDLIIYMFEKTDGDEPASVITGKDLAITIMKELLADDNVILDLCDIDSFEYDREYLVSLHNEFDTDYWHVSVEPIYNYEKEKYLSTDGYVLFHEDVNSKALVDMQNNEFTKLSGYDWFIIGEDESLKCTSVKKTKTNDKESNTSAVYRVNGKNVSKDMYNKAVSKIEEEYLDNMRDMLLNYLKLMDEINNYHTLFHW